MDPAVPSQEVRLGCDLGGQGPSQTVFGSIGITIHSSYYWLTSNQSWVVSPCPMIDEEPLHFLGARSWELRLWPFQTFCGTLHWRGEGRIFSRPMQPAERFSSKAKLGVQPAIGITTLWLFKSLPWKIHPFLSSVNHLFLWAMA